MQTTAPIPTLCVILTKPVPELITFKYKSYSNLLLELGKLDYIFEITQLSILDFQDKLNKSYSQEIFIKEKSEQFGIIVNFDKSNNLYNLVTLSQIASVYHYVETFFYELKDEYNEYTVEESQKLKFNQGETKLQSIINHLNKQKRINLIDKIPEYLIDIFEYYHILRVYFSHKRTIDEKEITAKRNKALKYFSEDESILTKYRIDSYINKKEDLSYNDFFLFTQVSKDLSLIISSLLYPNPEGFIKVEKLNNKKKSNSEEQKKRIITNYLKTNFGYICSSESDEKQFLNKLIKEL